MSKRPKFVPHLAGWATPAGWIEGLRPRNLGIPSPSTQNSHPHGNGNCASTHADIIRQIEQMEEVLGKRMYRGLLKTVARAWNPKDIQELAIQQKVLAHMQAANRGLHRAEAARDKTGPAALASVLRSLKLSSLDQVDNLKTLREIVVALEAAAVTSDIVSCVLGLSLTLTRSRPQQQTIDHLRYSVCN